MYSYSPYSQPCSRPPLTNAFARDSQTPTVKSPVGSLFLSPGSSIVGLMVTFSKRTYAIPTPRALCWVFTAAWLSLVMVSGGCPHCSAQASHRTASLVAGHRPWSTGDSGGQKSLGCCSSWGHKESDTTEKLNNSKELIAPLAWLSRGLWNLPRLRIEPMSPALAGGFLFTAREVHG